MADKTAGNATGPITIKKYANRRLYNTATSSYVTLDHLCQMVKDDIDFAVYDAKSGEDITRSVLTQIIVEEEAKGQNLLPINFLRQLISFYGDNLQWVVPQYLEHMMASFATNQDRMRQSMQDTFGGMFPFGNLDEMSRQNMAFFENAMKMFSPFGEGEGGPAPGKAEKPGGGGSEAKGTKARPAPAGAGESEQEAALAQLQKQVEQLQKQLNAMSRPSKDS